MLSAIIVVPGPMAVLDCHHCSLSNIAIGVWTISVLWLGSLLRAAARLHVLGLYTGRGGWLLFVLLVLQLAGYV